MLSLPIGCAIVAGLFAAGWLYTRQLVVLLAALSWAVFVPYTYWMFVNCPGDCMIRLDLVVEVPILLGLSAVAVVVVGFAMWRQMRAARGTVRP